MKNVTKIVVTFIALVMILSTLCVGVSASVTGKVGETVSATISFADSYGMDGTVTFSNPDIFSSYEITCPVGTATVSGNKLFVFGTVKTTMKIVVKATIKASAKPGDKCVITFNGYRTIDDEKDIPASGTETIIVGENKVDPPKPTEPKQTEPKPTEPKPTIPSVTEPPATDAPIDNGSRVDYTELERQIEIANSIKKDGYTDISWKSMTDALDAAIALRGSNSQSDVDAGAKKLKDAIAALKKMDYTALKEAIASTNAYLDSSDMTDLWNKLFAAMNTANTALSSGDQQTVDKATKDLLDALAALKKYVESSANEVKVEVPVEVEPENFCNIPFHKIVIILFVVSVIINIVFIVLTVLWFLRRKKNLKDDTPLVDYNIGDDD